MKIEVLKFMLGVTRRMSQSVTWSLVIALMLFTACDNADDPIDDPEVCVGIAWRGDADSEFYTNVVRTFQAAGVKTVMLPQVKADAFEYDGQDLDDDYYDEHRILLQTYADMVKAGTASNVAEVLKGIDAVVFTGGEDIAPTLYKQPEPWHGISEEEDYNATRDVNDYLLMSYVIQNNIPMLGMCRGMQMLGVVSGASVIQDIPVYFNELGKTYHYQHRNQQVIGGYRDYAPHDVDVKDQSSILYDIAKTTFIEGVPSWHHQAILSVEGTPLTVVATTDTEGVEMIEALERKDKRFVLGIQYHPEAAVVKHLDNYPNASDFMTYTNGMAYFMALAAAAELSNN
ncbi:MAG: gamma-glutamyl-gamma-aminobutyrate hydrolase family protein [Bacteroidaceae bacterium]|nr:gamma-glutamyl-gamma-aminobutyrate hydrolase family protein [Bacteroidaceae bacterium]